MLPHRCFRLIHRARSKSQKRRVYTWLVVFLLFVFMLFYSQGILSSHVEERVAELPVAGLAARLVNPALENDGQLNGFMHFARRNSDTNLIEIKDRDSRHPSNRSRVNNDKNYYGESNEDEESHLDLLPDLAPSIVHFVWCGTGRYFEFRHYLAVKRANNLVKPDKIIFHYLDLPVSDNERYYDWFNKSLTEIDHMILRPLNISRCDNSGPHKYMLILSLLESFGGVFVPEDAILVDFPVHLRSSSFISGVIAKTMTEYHDGIIVAKKNGFISPASQNGLNVVLASGRSESQGVIPPCGDRIHFNQFEQGDCVCVQVDSEIHPSSIWWENSKFATLARYAGYGVPAIEPNRNSKMTIPRIGHYICWNCDINFSMYLSVMSSLHVANLTKVYIHGLKEPTGVWWKRLQSSMRVVHVKREYPVHSRNKATLTQELAQGIMRLNILLKYGGVYCDNKVIWTNSIPDSYFEFDAVVSPDWHQLGAWPDAISHTTVMAKKNAEYLLKLRNLHNQNPRTKFWFVDQFLAYKILEDDPRLLYLDRHLQVKCLNHNCHPTWMPDYKIPMDENPPGHPFSWQNDTLSLYWDVFPPLELDTVKYTSGLVVDAARKALLAGGVSIQELRS